MSKIGNVIKNVRAKFYKSPRGIMDACIRDIDAGLWVCGDLACKPILDEWGTQDSGPKAPIMGCAIGLVGINSGAGDFNPKEAAYYLDYPLDDARKHRGRWSDAALKCIVALANTVPKGMRDDEGSGPNGEFTMDDARDAAVNTVINYNDGAFGDGVKPDKAAARAWFTDARNAL